MMLVYIWKQHFKSLVSIFTQVTQIKGSAAIFVDFLSFLLIRNDKNEKMKSQLLLLLSRID